MKKLVLAAVLATLATPVFAQAYSDEYGSGNIEPPQAGWTGGPYAYDGNTYGAYAYEGDSYGSSYAYAPGAAVGIGRGALWDRRPYGYGTYGSYRGQYMGTPMRRGYYGD